MQKTRQSDSLDQQPVVPVAVDHLRVRDVLHLRRHVARSVCGSWIDQRSISEINVQVQRSEIRDREAIESEREAAFQRLRPSPIL